MKSTQRNKATIEHGKSILTESFCGYHVRSGISFVESCRLTKLCRKFRNICSLHPSISTQSRVATRAANDPLLLTIMEKDPIG